MFKEEKSEIKNKRKTNTKRTATPLNACIYRTNIRCATTGICLRLQSFVLCTANTTCIFLCVFHWRLFNKSNIFRNEKPKTKKLRVEQKLWKFNFEWAKSVEVEAKLLISNSCDLVFFFFSIYENVSAKSFVRWRVINIYFVDAFRLLLRTKWKNLPICDGMNLSARIVRCDNHCVLN